jgi:hypothetical protein
MDSRNVLGTHSTYLMRRYRTREQAECVRLRFTRHVAPRNPREFGAFGQPQSLVPALMHEFQKCHVFWSRIVEPQIAQRKSVAWNFPDCFNNSDEVVQVALRYLSGNRKHCGIQHQYRVQLFRGFRIPNSLHSSACPQFSVAPSLATLSAVMSHNRFHQCLR